MEKKQLVLFCDNYPLTPYEPFVESEIQALSKRFENIFIFVPNQEQISREKISIPSNVSTKIYDLKVSSWDVVKSLFFLNRIVWSEISWLQKNNLLQLRNIKILIVDFIKAELFKKKIDQFIRDENCDIDTMIFYSYWHDFRALMLARLSKKKSKGKFISRAHRWDIYFDQNPSNYLPFKSYIIDNLDATYTISEHGKLEFERLLNRKLDDKVIVSRLGKYNNREPKLIKDQSTFLICSCSTLIPVKRVELIVEILSLLNIQNFKWIHFGEGSKMPEILELASKKLIKAQFDFKGYTSNEIVLDFYEKNYVDLFINVSESEGIPYSIMEAISAGIPILATDVGGTSESINKDFGYLLPKEFDVEKAASIIENHLNLSASEQLTMRNFAYEFWQNHFEASKNFEEFYNSITN
jgi:colanic acid/amylovoran biosynthesis glycosyltransferase